MFHAVARFAAEPAILADGEAVTLPVDVKVNATAIARERKGGGAPDLLRATAAVDRGGIWGLIRGW